MQLTQIQAPFTLEQVIALNAYQRRGAFHPFTCSNRHETEQILTATVVGWSCPSCMYKQDWAYGFMALPACELCGDGDSALELTDDLRLYCKDCR